MAAHRVVAYSGCSYANEPREFFIDDEHHVVAKVDSARTEQVRGEEGMTRSVWDVRDSGGKRFRLTYHWVQDLWEIESL
jgi:hypothetical protein